MVAELLVQRIELLARSRAHDAGEAEVAPFPARPHLHGRWIELRSVLDHNFGHRLGEARLLAAHHLDGEITGERQRQAVGDYRHAGLPLRPAATRAGPPASLCA